MSETFKLIGHDCPLGSYPSLVVPIGEFKGNLVAVLITSDDICYETIPFESDYLKHSKNIIDNTNPFDTKKHGLFAVNEQDVRRFEFEDETNFFKQFLEDSEFSVERPFFRYTLAKKTGNIQLVLTEFKSCFDYYFISDKMKESFSENEILAKEIYERELLAIMKFDGAEKALSEFYIPKVWEEARRKINLAGRPWITEHEFLEQISEPEKSSDHICWNCHYLKPVLKGSTYPPADLIGYCKKIHWPHYWCVADFNVIRKCYAFESKKSDRIWDPMKPYRKLSTFLST